MFEALVIYLIVGVAAVWVLWSIVLPNRLRRAMGRRLAGRAGVAAAAGLRSCGDADCPGCAVEPGKRMQR